MLLGCVSWVACGAAPAGGPTPAASLAPTPTQTPTPTEAAPTPVPLEITIVDTQGEPWEGATVFIGADGAGPWGESDSQGHLTLAAPPGEILLSIYHTYTTRYAQQDTYTVNRINTYPRVDASAGSLNFTLFRDVDWTGNPRPIDNAQGVIEGVDTGADASRIVVLGGDGSFVGQPVADPLAYELDSSLRMDFLYAAQVPIDPEGTYGLGRVPFAFELLLGPSSREDLTLGRTYSESIDLAFSGADPLCTRRQEAYLWTLPEGQGALDIYDATYPLSLGEVRTLALPPEDPLWAGDTLDLRVAALGTDRQQVLERPDITRGDSLDLTYHPVPQVAGRTPLTSPTLPGSVFELEKTEGSTSVVFFFSERWYRLAGTYGGFDLIYDIYSVSTEGEASALEIPDTPPGLPWPTELESIYQSLDRQSYIQTVFEDGRSRRELDVIPPIP